MRADSPIIAFLRVLIPDQRPVFAATGGILAAAALGVGLLAAPHSPLACSAFAPLDRSAPDALADRLDAADGWASPASRAEQLWRACLLAETSLGDNPRALSCVDRLLQEHPDSVHQYDALSLRARILERTSPSRAAEAWAAVADLLPAHPDAGSHWLRAADLRAQAGDQQGALAAYKRAANHAPQAARAWLAIGRLSLSQDPAQAHAAFDRALHAAQRPAMVRVARLGVATALERLEGREAALAEVDEAIAESGPDVSLERRRDRLRAGG